jgi:acetolactate synthase-1/2/3 large subunit
MSTGEAIVATLIAHGLDTVYALPGLHLDPLFDAMFASADRIRAVHPRHEQAAAYMALGAALATGRPQAYAAVPGPGFLNTSAALLHAYSMNAPVLALIGEIPEPAIGRSFGHLHELRDQANLLARIAGHAAHIPGARDASRLVAQAIAAMREGRPGPSALECAMDTLARQDEVELSAPLPPADLAVDEDALRQAAKLLGGAVRPLIVCGGGAQDAAAEVTELSRQLQAPVLGYRRGRGVLDSRDPLSVTLPVGHELWAEADVVLGVGTRLFLHQTQWGLDDALKVVRIDADPDEPARLRPPEVALIGDAKPILQKLLELLPVHNARRASRKGELEERQARTRKRLEKLAPQIGFLDAMRAELPEDGIYVDEVTQIGFVSRLVFPVYAPRTFLSPGYQDNLGWGFATALGVQDARRDVPVLSISGDGGFLYTAAELATAVRHRIPLTVVVFSDGAFGNVRRIQEEQYGNRLIACDLTNPDFVRLAESFGVRAERARDPEGLRGALRRSFASREPALVEVPVGPLPSPWEFIQMKPVRGPGA